MSCQSHRATLARLPVIPLATRSQHVVFDYDQVVGPHRSYRPSGPWLPRGKPRTRHMSICLQLSGARSVDNGGVSSIYRVLFYTLCIYRVLYYILYIYRAFYYILYIYRVLYYILYIYRVLHYILYIYRILYQILYIYRVLCYILYIYRVLYYTLFIYHVLYYILYICRVLCWCRVSKYSKCSTTLNGICVISHV